RNELPRMAKFGDHREPVFAGQHDVEDDQVKILRSAGQYLESGLACVGQIHLVAFRFQVEAQTRGEMLLVLDDQDPAHAYCGGPPGSCNMKVLPMPVPWLSA